MPPGMHWETLVRRGIDFPALESLQNSCHAQVVAQPDLGFLLFSEPQATFTGGSQALPEELLLSPEALRQNHQTTIRVDRGGKWTYHGPGQIVIYPVVHLPALGFDRRDIRNFLNTFRHCIQQPLISLGLPVESGDAPFGIYAAGKKLASFGIRVERGVCRHGVALYFSPQSAAFSGIHPCGVPNQAITSVSELGGPISWEGLVAQLAESIKKGLKSLGNPLA